MVVSNGVFVYSRGVNDDEGEKVGVLAGHKRQNQTNIESLSPNIDVENGECDVFRCHEVANKRIRFTPKENDQEVAMAEILLNLRPIGLKLNNLPDLVKTIEKHVNYTNHQAGITHRPNNTHAKVDDHYSPQQMTEKEKLKASNFTASLLKIGSWERVTRNEGDLVAKCYYAKKKLVWEFLERGLKSKIEIQWSDILAMRADIQENKPGILEIEVSKPPTFHNETDPQPRKHTIWRLTTDFTGGEASKWRRHYLRFPPGSLDKHYEKLLQCDSRLLAISQQRFPSLKSPIFESSSFRIPGFSLDFNGRGVHMNHPGMHWPIPRFPQPDFVQNQLQYQSFTKPTPLSFLETPSPISVMDLSHSDELCGGNNGLENSRMALWGGNGVYQGLQSTAYHHLHHRRPDQTLEMNQVQGIESIVSTTTPLDRNVSYAQNYDLVPYDEAMESSQLELLSEMQYQLLSDTSQVGVYDNNYHLARVASLNALVDLAKEQKGNSTSGSDQALYGVDLFGEDNLDLSIEEASDQLGSGFDQFCDQQQHRVPYNAPAQVSSENTMMHDHQLPWSNSATYSSSTSEGYDHQGNTVIGVNHWS